MSTYNRTYTLNPAPGGDSVKTAVLGLDTDLSGAFTGLNTLDTGKQAGSANLTSIAALTTVQIQSLTTQGIASLSTTQIATLGTGNLPTLAALSTTQVATLSSTNLQTISGLSTVQIQSLGTAGIAAYSTSQIAALVSVPQNTQSVDYTCVLGDAGKAMVESGSSKTITIPANGSVAYPVGSTLTFANNTSGTMSIAITTDTMYLAGTATTGTRTLAQRGMATAYKISSTVWFISGAGLT